MNERIRELARQAGWCIVDDDEHSTYFGKFAEKFAQLIVDECLNQCYYRGMNDELYAGQLRAALYIEQHFGVEP